MRKEDTGGDDSVRREISDMLVVGSQEIKLRFACLCRVPWVCARVDGPLVAAEIIRHMESQPLDRHDPRVQDIRRRLQADIRQVMVLGAVSKELSQEIRHICYACFDESAGEG